VGFVHARSDGDESEDCCFAGEQAREVLSGRAARPQDGHTGRVVAAPKDQKLIEF
jgi:hypothetical protein